MTVNLICTKLEKIAIQEVWCKLSFASCASHLDFGPNLLCDISHDNSFT